MYLLLLRSVMTVGCLVSILLAMISTSFGQTTEATEMSLPFRRVFVPVEDLKKDDADGLVEMDAKELEQLLLKYAREHETLANNYMETDGKPHLLSTHYVARLVGADLLSERSRLSVSKTFNPGDRLTLQPWSIAINSRLSAPTGPVVQSVELPRSELPRSEMSTSNWTYDEQGTPRVSSFDSDWESKQRSEVVHWFGWSARADANSSPNRLQFSFSIPRCADSFLLLALPPQAVIQDSATVATRVEPSTIDARLSDWTETAKRSLDLNPLRQESLWLIELGGSQRVAFSIDLGTGSRELDSRDHEAYRYMQLIRSQRLEHVVDAFEIRTTCEAEILTQQSPEIPIRLSLAPGSRLRRLMVNQQEVDWHVYKGWIQWSNVPAKKEPTDAGSVERFSSIANQASNRVYAEFVTPISGNQLSALELPRIAFDRGYVMTGSTQAVVGEPWRLTSSECEAGRIMDSPSGGNPSKVSSLEYSWNASPPSFRIGVEQEKQTRRCELLTRVSNEDRGTTVKVRGRFQFLDQDANGMSVQIAKGWKLQSLSSLDTQDPVNYESSPAQDSSLEQLNLTWERVQKNRLAELEFVLFLQADRDQVLEQIRKIALSDVVVFSGWECNETLLIEDSANYSLKLRDSLLEHLVSEDSLPDWQRSLIQRGPYVYIVRADASHKQDRELSWNLRPDFHKSRILTSVRMGSDQVFVAEHELRVELGANRAEPIQIELESELARWQKLEGSTWVAIAPKAVRGIWSFELEDTVDVFRLRAIVPIPGRTEEPTRVVVPKVLRSIAEQIHAKAFDRNIALSAFGMTGHWTVDDEGDKLLNLDPSQTQCSFYAQVSVSTQEPDWSAMRLGVDVALDSFGSQKALLHFASASPLAKPLAIEMPSDWKPLMVQQRVHGAYETIAFQVDGDRLLIPYRNGTAGDSESDYVIELLGPTLERRNFRALGRGNFDFDWPQFAMESRWQPQVTRLWLPKELVVSHPSNRDVRNTSGSTGWPLKDWLTFKVGSVFNRFPKPATRMPSPSAKANKMLPSWMESQWYVAVEFVGDASEWNKSATVQIDATDADRSPSAILFVFFALITPRLILFRARTTTLIAFLLLVAAHLELRGIASYAIPCFLGMVFGFASFVVYQLLYRTKETEDKAGQRNSTRWSPWNDGNSASRESRNDSIRKMATSLSVLIYYIAIGMFIFGSDGLSARLAFSQTQVSSATGDLDVHEILIPIDREGNLAGPNVYLPATLKNMLTGDTELVQQVDTGSHPYSAKHVLRLRPRGRVFASDDITLTYEFMIGKDAVPIRFPMMEQFKDIRFSVDGNDFSKKVKRQGIGSVEEWIWTPEKPGKRIVQINAQLRPLKDSLDISLIPVANASMEIEADPQLGIEVVSRGRVTNPGAGRYVAMLGAVDRFECKVISNIPTLPATDEYPVMNTELFVQKDVLQAKTIIDFPKSIPLNREIEIEADTQWLPVGTQWGDAQWVDLKLGTTFSRRIYVLEWKNNTSGPNGSPRDRQISVVWIPQSLSTNLNVLFAECRDRRVRQGTFRYAGIAGSNWTIDGISKWRLEVNSKERLDWPELSSNPLPLATTLGIKPSTGLGILQPKSNVERQNNSKSVSELQNARISSRWTIDGGEESLSSRIELVGGSNSNEPFTIELEKSFVVSEVYNRIGPIRFLQHARDGKVQLQLLSDRKQLETSDLWIQAKRILPPLAETEPFDANPDTSIGWNAIPWLGLSAMIKTDQTLEVFATERTVLRLDQISKGMVNGKGLVQPILSWTKSSLDSLGTALRYKTMSRMAPLKGSMILSSSTGAKEIVLQGQIAQRFDSKSFFVLQIPTQLKDRWVNDTRDAKTQLISCPVPNCAWIQVSFPQRLSAVESPAVFVIRFAIPSEGTQNEMEWMEGIRSLDQEEIPTYLVGSPGPESMGAHWQLLESSVRDSLLEQFGLSAETKIYQVAVGRSLNPGSGVVSISHDGKLDVALCTHRLLNRNVATSVGEAGVLMESRYLLRGNDIKYGVQSVEWLVGENVDVKSVRIDGVRVAFSQIDSIAKCSLVSVGLCSEISVVSLHRLPGNDGVALRDDRMRETPIVAIKLQNANSFPSICTDDFGDIALSDNGSKIPQRNEGDLLALAAPTWLDIFESSLEKTHALVKNVRTGSDWDLWSNYWSQRAYSDLMRWSAMPGSTSSDAFSNTVRKWQLTQQRYLASRPSLRWESAEIEGSALSNPKELPQTVDVARWVSLAICFIVLVLIGCTRDMLSELAINRPWWSLLGLGGLAWLICGSLLPAFLLGCVGLAIAIDSYVMFSVRLRRIGLLGPRSL